MALAARGAREVGGRSEPVGDPQQVARARAVARRIHLLSVLAALALTALLMLCP